MASDDVNERMSETEDLVEEVPVQPINSSRSEYVDFTINCKDGKGKLLKYGTEKAILASTCGFFEDLFRINSSPTQAEELEMMECTANVVFLFLSTISGKMDHGMLNLDDASDLIDLGHKYRSDAVMLRGVNMFLRSFANLALDKESKGPKSTRFGKGVLIKYISLYKRGIEGDLCFPPDLHQQFYWDLPKVAAGWVQKCGLNIATVSCYDLIEYKNGKYFTGEDITVFCLYFQKCKHNFLDTQLVNFLRELKSEGKDETVTN